MDYSIYTETITLPLFIFFVYKKTFAGVMYSASFGVSMLAMTLVTTLIILAITSNVILSLGMVGALSIVRFRTAVKEPLDIAFLFWSISAGIVIGAGLIPLAIIGSVIVGVILLVFVNKKSTDTPYIIVLSLANDEAESGAMELLKEKAKKNIIKSKTVTKDGIELTVEVRLIDMSAKGNKKRAEEMLKQTCHEMEAQLTRVKAMTVNKFHVNISAAIKYAVKKGLSRTP